MPFTNNKPTRFKVLGQIEPDSWKVKAASESDPVTEDDLTFLASVEVLQQELSEMKAELAHLISSKPAAPGGMGAVKDSLGKTLDDLETQCGMLCPTASVDPTKFDYEYQEWHGFFWRNDVLQRKFEALERDGWQVFAHMKDVLVLRRKRQHFVNPPEPKS